MEIVPISNSTRKLITNLWQSYFDEFESFKPLKLFKVYDFFVLSLELRIVSGNASYEPIFKLYSLAKKDFKLPGASLFYQSFRDHSGLWLWVKFEEPLESAQKYFDSINNQAILPLFGDVKYGELIKAIKFTIEQGVILTNIGTPFLQYEFLIHTAVLNPNKDEGLQLFEFSIAEIKKIDKERLSFFVKDVESYFEKLEEEFNNSDLLIQRISENKKKLKLLNISQHKILYQ